MILKDVFKEGSSMLKLISIEAPVVEAGAILCHVLGCDKTFLYSHDDYCLSKLEYDTYFKAINRRVDGEPLQYITGNQEFMSLNFLVTPDVLIPRQDTEVLVESIIQYAKEKGTEGIAILDIGTGSGCIAISLAYYLRNSKVTAVDISKEALDIAKRNADRCGVNERINFVESNLFDNVETYKNSGFDIIVSNPPYIPGSEIETLERQVKDFEPASALDGGRDGLDFYRLIAKDSVQFLKFQGLLAFEVGFRQAKDVLGIMEDDFCNLQTKRDLSSIERVVMGNLKRNTL